MSTVATPSKTATKKDRHDVPVHALIQRAVGRLGLTPREADLTELLAVGSPTKGISKTLDISEATIRTHLRKIFAGQQIASRVELVARVLDEVLRDIERREQRHLLAS